MCFWQPSHLENCTAFPVQVHCAKIALKNTNPHLSSTPCRAFPFFPYAGCVTAKSIKCRLYSDMFITGHKRSTYSMLLHFELHFISSLLLPTTNLTLQYFTPLPCHHRVQNMSQRQKGIGYHLQSLVSVSR